MRVAVLGGTGSFGRALAARLAAVGEDEIVIGSRDADARPRDGARARRQPSTGSDQRGRGARRRSRRARGQGRRGTRHRARGRAARSATRRCSRSRRRSSSSKGVGALPDPRRAQPRRAHPGRGRRPGRRRSALRSPPRTSTTRRPTRTRSSAATTSTRRRSRSSSPARIVAGSALDAGPLAERPRARRADSGDRQSEPPLQGARRRAGHRRLDQPPNDRAHPGARPAGDPARATTSRRWSAELVELRDRRRRRRRAEGRLEGRRAARRARRARAVGQGSRAGGRRARSS